jgi:hypothetical protein
MWRTPSQLTQCACGSSPPLVLLDLRAQARFPLAHFRRGGVAKILDLEYRPDLDLALLLVWIGAAPDPLGNDEIWDAFRPPRP